MKLVGRRPEPGRVKKFFIPKRSVILNLDRVPSPEPNWRWLQREALALQQPGLTAWSDPTSYCIDIRAILPTVKKA
jgi:hypothetical protein